MQYAKNRAITFHLLCLQRQKVLFHWQYSSDITTIHPVQIVDIKKFKRAYIIEKLSLKAELDSTNHQPFHFAEIEFEINEHTQCLSLHRFMWEEFLHSGFSSDFRCAD